MATQTGNVIGPDALDRPRDGQGPDYGSFWGQPEPTMVERISEPAKQAIANVTEQVNEVFYEQSNTKAFVAGAIFATALFTISKLLG